MRTTAFLLLTLLSVNFAVGQNLKKAFKYLTDKDFDRAKVIFDEVSNQPDLCALACYGTSLIYMDEQYRSKDLYRAFEAISKSVKSLDKVNATELEKISEYIQSKETILKQKDKIDFLLYQQVKNDNSIQSSERFLKEAVGSTYQNAIKAIYATQRFNQAVEFNTIMAYEDFIKEFPEALEVQTATQKIYLLAFQQALKLDKITDYQYFVEKYPNAPQIELARKKILENEYEMVILTGTDDAFDRFIRKYPETQQAKEIRQKQLQLNYIQARQLNTVNVYNNFLKKFSDSEYVNEITIIRDSMAYKETRQINTPQAYKEFINKYPNAPQVAKVMSLQKDLSFSKLELSVFKQKEKIASRNISKKEFYKLSKTDSTQKTLVNVLSYDANGNIVKEWEKTIVGAEVTIQRSYSEDGRHLLSEEKIIDGIPRYKISFFYAQNDLLDSALKICYQPCEDGLSTGSYLYLYEYYADRNLKGLTITGANFLKKSSFIINNQKLVSQEFIMIKENMKLTELKINYQYDFYDQLIQKTTFTDENTIGAVETFFYNKEGDVLKYSSYDALGKIRKTNSYGSNGLLQSTDIEFPNDSTNNHTLVCRYITF